MFLRKIKAKDTSMDLHIVNKLYGHNTTVLEILARQLGTAIAYKEMHHKEGK